MNREDITRMALEAGVRAAKLLHEFGTEGALCDSEIQDLRAAERLAQAAYAAGAAAERRHVWSQKHWTEYERSIAAAAKAEEREACVAIAEAHAIDREDEYVCDKIANAIRARGETK